MKILLLQTGSAWVHLRQKNIRQSTGLEVGEFYVAIRVHTAEEGALFQKWDRTLELLSSGEDAIAIKEFCAIMFLQRDGQLTLDNSREDLSPYYRDYILSKRPAHPGSSTWPGRMPGQRAPSAKCLDPAEFAHNPAEPRPAYQPEPNFVSVASNTRATLV